MKEWQHSKIGQQVLPLELHNYHELCTSSALIDSLCRQREVAALLAYRISYIVNCISYIVTVSASNLLIINDCDNCTNHKSFDSGVSHVRGGGEAISLI